MKYLFCLPLLFLAGCSTQQQLLEENRHQKEIILMQKEEIRRYRIWVHNVEMENNDLREENNALWKNVKEINNLILPAPPETNDLPKINNI